MSGREQPDRETIATSDRLVILDHPLVANLLTTLRDVNSPPAVFEIAMHELTRFLLWNAIRAEPVEALEISSFSGETIAGTRFPRRIAALVILRAGLGMVPPLRALIPEAPIYQIGVKRDEATLEPQLYSSNLPSGFKEIEHLLILDPMLATGGSARMALELVRMAFDGDISFLGLIGAPIGVSALHQADPQLRVYLAALDDCLDMNGYIVPGLGDAGDRLFGTK